MMFRKNTICFSTSSEFHFHPVNNSTADENKKCNKKITNDISRLFYHQQLISKNTLRINISVGARSMIVCFLKGIFLNVI